MDSLIFWLFLFYCYKPKSHIRCCYVIIHSIATVQATTCARRRFGIGFVYLMSIKGGRPALVTCILPAEQPSSLHPESQNNKHSYWNGTHLLIWLKHGDNRQTFQTVEPSLWASAWGAFKSSKMLNSELTAVFTTQSPFLCVFGKRAQTSCKTGASQSGLATDLSHELLGGENQLVVDDPAWQLFKQGAVGVNVHSLLVLHSLVAAFGQPGSVIKISSCNCLEESS